MRVRGSVGRDAEQLVEAFRPHLGFHHHARATAHRGVVDGLMHIVRPLPQIMRAHGEQTPLLRFAEQTEIEHVEILGEDGNDVDVQTNSFEMGSGWESGMRWASPLRKRRQIGAGRCPFLRRE